MQHNLLRSFLTDLILLLAALVFHASIGLAEEQKLILGSTANLGVLPLVAKHDSIFVKNGIEVDYRKFQTGKMTMDALISGDIEIGTIVDSNVAFIGYSKNPIKVIASLASFQNHSTLFDDAFFQGQLSDNSKGGIAPVVFCRPNNMVSALLYIAEAKGFFTAHGIEPKFETATNAKICQDLLVAKKADYMSGGEGPFTYLAASKPPLKILAMLQQNPETSVFARKDRGISSFSDLKGKRIAYLPGTVSYFFLGRIMKKYNIARTELKLSSMQPPAMPAALVGGAVDAFSMWEPWGTQAVMQMPDKVINLTEPELYRYESLLTGHSDAITKHPDVPGKILKALIQAEKFIQDHNDEAFAILSKAITFEPSAFKRLWPQYVHKVRLEEGPLDLMRENFELLKEDDANFKDEEIPDFRDFVEDSYLRTVDSVRVQLNHSATVRHEEPKQ